MNKAFEKILERLEENTIQNKDSISFFKECGIKFVSACKAKEIVQEVAEEYNNGWISCSERLPEEFEATNDIEQMIYEGKATEYTVMIYGAKKATTLYYAGDGYWYDEVSQDYYDVIAWQPLPEPYKESEKE